MKKLLFIALLVSSFTFAHNTPNQDSPKVGDVLVINTPENNSFQHIDFPKLNFIVKKGGLPTYSSVYGKEVIVTNVSTNKSGNTEVTLKSKDNKKFFGYLTAVKANYNDALNKGELSKI